MGFEQPTGILLPSGGWFHRQRSPRRDRLPLRLEPCIWLHYPDRCGHGHRRGFCDFPLKSFPYKTPEPPTPHSPKPEAPATDPPTSRTSNLISNKAIVENITFKTKFSQHTDCKKIVEAEVSPFDLKNQLKPQSARAQPNRRLKVAFNIGNCFITDDLQECDKFREGVEKLIHVDAAKWEDFAATAKAIVQEEFQTEDASINLFSLIQLVTMKMTRKVMWNIDPRTDQNDDAIRRLAHEVNQQWLRSKGPFKSGDQPTWRFDQQHELKSALNSAFPDWAADDNPFNLILPGYETIWRVVLRCFVEVTSRSHSAAPEWKQFLFEFLHNPTRDQLDKQMYGISAAIISK